MVLLASGALLVAGAIPLFRGGVAPVAQVERAGATQPAPAASGEAPRRLRGEAPGRTEKHRAKEVAPPWIQSALAHEQEEETKRREFLDIDPTLSLEAQQDVFLNRLTAVAGVDPRKQEAHLVRSQATELFLRLEPVQAHLTAMTVEQRRAALSEIRRRMGFSEELIARQAADDVYRDARWENGHAYMKAREELLSRFGEGEALETELSSLREKYFKHEAPTIAREEDTGFFRYQRRRIYGRN
ncbi:hypothetical protein P2318_17630 [Myxococcaceae bacterium GXIMD 01537]